VLCVVVQLATIILEQTVKTRWKVLPPEQRQGIKTYVVNLIIKLSSDPKSLAANKTFLTKLNMVLVQIVKQEWPEHWPNFIPELVNSSKTSQSLCANNMNILMVSTQHIGTQRLCVRVGACRRPSRDVAAFDIPVLRSRGRGKRDAERVSLRGAQRIDTASGYRRRRCPPHEEPLAAGAPRMPVNGPASAGCGGGSLHLWRLSSVVVALSIAIAAAVDGAPSSFFAVALLRLLHLFPSF